jgi:hypothetical protein
LSLGARYEYFSPFADAQGRTMAYRVGARSARFPDAPAGVIYAGDFDPLAGRPLPKSAYYADKNNLAQRMALAYSPRGEKGLLGQVFRNQRAVLRLGYGLFYDIGFGTPGQPFFFCQEPFCRSATLLEDTLSRSPDPFANPLPSGFRPESGFSGLPLGLTVFDPRFRSAYTHQWTLSFQRELPMHFFLEAAYVGRSSIKLLRARDLNQPAVKADHMGNIEIVRRDPHFSVITNFESTGTASYHALQAHLTRRWAAGLQAEISYSWGKALDNIANLRLPDAAVSIPNVHARSSFDRRHTLVANFIYALPSPSQGVWQCLLGGWQVAGIITARTGQPLDISQSDERYPELGDSLPDLVGPFRRLDPREARTFQFPNGEVRSGNFYFDPTVFQFARDENGLPRQGNLGRNVFSRPGINNWDMALLKRTRLGERVDLELRLEASNVFNHTQFNSVAQQLHNIFFGQASTLDTARKVQFGAKLHF